MRWTAALAAALAAGAGWLLAAAPAAAGPAACAPDRVLIATDAGPVAVTVEIADDPAERARGLMHRTSLPTGTGMLFLYDPPQPVAFWMRNTLIPLDMIFADARGVIRHVHARAIPGDETPIPGAVPGDPDPARALILEIGGGEAARLGIAAGQAMAHPALDPAVAAAACG